MDRIFSRPERVHVANTNIFARMEADGIQALVYSMQLGAAAELAMILPLPILPGAGEQALEFMSFEGHSNFFDTLAQLFVVPMPAARGGPAIHFAPQARAPLPVHSVGAFEASFVPTQRDFDRLDPRFRIPESVWQQIGGYDDFGFAVFRLAPGKKANVHPMALRFQTRDRTNLFFPTVHVHDGTVHPSARFDHYLYYQSNAPQSDERAPLALPATAHPLLQRDLPVYRRRLHGKLPNRDTRIAL